MLSVRLRGSQVALWSRVLTVRLRLHCVLWECWLMYWWLYSVHVLRIERYQGRTTQVYRER